MNLVRMGELYGMMSVGQYVVWAVMNDEWREGEEEHHQWRGVVVGSGFLTRSLHVERVGLWMTRGYQRP